MKIAVGKGSCGIAAGASKVESAIKNYMDNRRLDYDLTTTGCIGMCYLEPIIEIEKDNIKKTYVHVTESTVPQILEAALNGSIFSENAISDEDTAFLSNQTRIALRNCGNINPEDISDYEKAGGYQAIKKVLSLTSDEIIQIMKVSQIGGRGGAGFPTWFKWNQAKLSQGETKYIICNADEGDPGAFMDRSILEGDPHSLIEGMLIGAFAISAFDKDYFCCQNSEGRHKTTVDGVVYVRAEYPLAIERLSLAIEQAEKRGYLGKNILNSGFDFSLRIKAGAGAFVCGEETALIASLEGERGMPRLKPPFPAQKGFWQKPSNINNVETYANVPWIIQNGGEAFAELGTENSKGTKVFALTGKIKKGGLVEIPMGMTIRDIIFDIGGGIKDGKKAKAVQMGGPSGGCIPESLFDTVIDYKSINATGAIMGSGGMVVVDETTCMVDMSRFFLRFTCNESCGKCIHCRIGTKRMLEILERICEGNGQDGDIELLEELSENIKSSSLCGLGQTAPNPVLTTLKYFKDEYIAHINDKKCPAKSCTALLSYEITSNCRGCALCVKSCPVQAITGERKNKHTIDIDKCIKCGKCKSVCRFDAVTIN